MLRFDPPEFRTSFITAAKTLKEILEFEIGLIRSSEMIADDFDPASYDDDEVITPESSLDGWLLSTDNSAFSVCARDVVEWAEILRQCKLKDRTSLRLENKTIFNVEHNSPETFTLVEDIRDRKASVSQEITIDGERYVASLFCGINPFAVLIESQRENDKDSIPSFHDSIAYLQVLHPKTAAEETVESIANSFLFEIVVGNDLNFCIAPYPTVEDYEDYLEQDDEDKPKKLKLRPMCVGRGLKDVHQLYNAGCSANPAEYALIHFVKVIEYVSATVVRQQRHDALRRRLSSTAALSPDAMFLDGLASLIEEQRVFAKDSEALKLTLHTCCDPTTLASLAPTFLKQLRALRFTDDSKLRKTAIDEFAACLSATRNQLSHAKANYTLNGSECPDDELADLTICAREAAQQAIRWYASLPDHARLG